MIAAKIRNARTLLSRKGVHGTELLKGSRCAGDDSSYEGRPPWC